MRVFPLVCLLLAAFSAQAQDLLGELRDQGTGYAQVIPGQQLQFPRDHGAHPDYRIEWWYITANLADEDNRNWGLQWTLFRQALDPGSSGTGWQSHQIWMAHAAITTPDGHFHEQRFARGGIGQAGVTRIDHDGLFNAWLDNWQWRSEAADLFPAKLEFSVQDWEIEMQLDSVGQLVLNGVDGYSQKSAQGQASYYYSQPHIRVKGSVRRNSRETLLNGQGWLDREWSSQALADNQQGWDWFSLHLDDGRKLMLYQLRHDDGEHWLSGSWIDLHGTSLLLGAGDIDLRPLQLREVRTAEDQLSSLPLEWHISLPGKDRSWNIRHFMISNG